VLGVCIGSVLPDRTLDRLLHGLDVPDKIEHVASYFLLMIWFAGLYSRRSYAVIALTLAALGAALEVVQGQLGYRTFDLLDLLADVVGIGGAWLLAATLLEGWCYRVERFLFASR
jgi:VanZ family protein